MSPVVERAVVAIVDAEHPRASVPSHRTIEVGELQIPVVLPAVEHVAQVSIAAVPPRAVDAAAVDTHQVVEVDFIDCGILGVGEVELVSHFIREEQSFAAGVAVSHCRGRDGHDHHHCQNHHLLHILISYIFKLLNDVLYVHVAKISTFLSVSKGMFLNCEG